MDDMTRTLVTDSIEAPNTPSRGRFLQRVGLGATGVALGGGLLDVLTPGRARAAVSFTPGALNVSYWSTVTPKQDFLNVLDGFAKQNGLSVTFNPEPAAYSDFVQKYTTYLSSGYKGLDVMWTDDFSVPAWGTAGWLEPLESRVSHASVAAIPATDVASSTYGGHLYRLVGHLDVVIFFYNKQLFAKAGLEPPRTWQELVRVGQRLTSGGRYGIGIAGKNGSGLLFNELCYWLGQAGASPLHLKTPAARTALQFIYDMINTHKIAPPDTATADYTSLQASFLDGRVAMWPVWDGFYGAFQAVPAFVGKVGVALPPHGPANNHTISGAWGWSISKFSQNKDVAAKFIDYATSPQSETTLALTGSQPGRSTLLSEPSVAKVIRQAPYLEQYAAARLPQQRPLGVQTQRLSDALESAINPYLNKRTSLDAAINQAQAQVDQIQGNS